jgi:hypothetical protein
MPSMGMVVVVVVVVVEIKDIDTQHVRGGKY